MSEEKRTISLDDPASSKEETGIPDDAAATAILKHGLDADEAMKAFVGFEEESLVLDDETNKALLRKIDLNIMPVGYCYPVFRSIMLDS